MGVGEKIGAGAGPSGAERSGHPEGAASDGTTVAAVSALLARNGSPMEVADILSSHPQDQSAVMLLLHTTRGNSYVQQVTTAMGSSKRTSSAHDPIDGSPAAQLALDRPPRSPNERKHEHVALAEHSIEALRRSVTGTLGTLIPGYVAARNNLDTASVAELGGRLLGAFNVMHGAKCAFDKLAPAQQSVPGGTAESDLAAAGRETSLHANADAIANLIGPTDIAIARTLTPHVFRGTEVAGHEVSVQLVGDMGTDTAKLAGELERTIDMLSLVEELSASLKGKGGLERSKLDAGRYKIAAWAGRPLDIAFLRAALGRVWDVYDATAEGPMLEKPSDALEEATKHAAHTGWLADTGRFDLNTACTMIEGGMAEAALGDLYTADPDTRARLLIEIQQRGLFDKFCDAFGWQELKQLHDSLGYGFSDLRHALQAKFTGKGKFGPTYDSEWENHDSSLHHLVGSVPGVGGALNFALDVGTFGFNSSYGKALDDESEGLISSDEARAERHNAWARMAAVAMVSTITGGVADKFVRGGAATVSTARAIAGGAAAGGFVGTSALLASDTYNVYGAGTQSSLSSPSAYVETALIGGLVGGAIGGVTSGLSRRAAEYTSNSEVGARPDVATAAPSVGAEPVVVEPRISAAARASGLDLGALTPVQRTLLEAADGALERGNISESAKLFDELANGGVPKETVATLENELARTLGKTPPSVYRDPKATLPNGAEVPPSVWGGVKYYGTSEIPPEIAFADGFPGRGSDTDLLQHSQGALDRAFRGTTEYLVSPDGQAGAGAWAEEGGWVYKIDGTPSWDLNAELEGRVPQSDGSFGGNRMHGEHEHSVLANIPKERIIGAFKMTVDANGTLRPGPMISNPNYVPIT